MKIIDPTEHPGWDDLLLSIPEATVFHTSSWAKVLRESYGYRPVYFTEFENSKISALVPFMEVDSMITGKRGVSLPFTDSCEVINPKKTAFQDLIRAPIEYGKRAKWKSLEIRDGKHLIPEHPVFFYYHGHMLDLKKGEKRVWSDFRDSTQRNIQKAIREGVEVVLEKTPGAIDQFYRLHCHTRKGHGLPPQPKTFFTQIYRQIISKGRGFVALASIKEKVIAAAVIFHFGNSCIYKYGAADKNFQSRRPTNAVIWESIRWAVRHNFTRYSFGRTDAHDSGLIQFKNGWGAEIHKIYYQKYDLSRGKFVENGAKQARFREKIFAKLPIPVLRAVGSLLYRHAG